MCSRIYQVQLLFFNLHSSIIFMKLFLWVYKNIMQEVKYYQDILICFIYLLSLFSSVQLMGFVQYAFLSFSYRSLSKYLNFLIFFFLIHLYAFRFKHETDSRRSMLIPVSTFPTYIDHHLKTIFFNFENLKISQKRTPSSSHKNILLQT